MHGGQGLLTNSNSKVISMLESLQMPHTAPHQMITNMANSSREVITLCDNQRTGELQTCHAFRIHELMRFRSHTVNTDGEF